MSVSVLISDDAAVVRRAIRCLFADFPEIELVGEAEDFAQTIQLAKDLKPQVIVMDLHVADATPAEVRSQLGLSRLLAMSLSNDEEAKFLAESFGAAQLLDKMYLSDELVPAILQSAAPKEQGAKM